MLPFVNRFTLRPFKVQINSKNFRTIGSKVYAGKFDFSQISRFLPFEYISSVPLGAVTFVVTTKRKFLVLRIKQTKPVLLHLQKLYPYASSSIESQILSRWNFSKEAQILSIPEVTPDMIRKWTRLNDEFALQGGRPNEGYSIDEDETYLLKQLLRLKHSLILYDEKSTIMQTAVMTSYLLNLLRPLFCKVI